MVGETFAQIEQRVIEEVPLSIVEMLKEDTSLGLLGGWPRDMVLEGCAKGDFDLFGPNCPFVGKTRDWRRKGGVWEARDIVDGRVVQWIPTQDNGCWYAQNTFPYTCCQVGVYWLCTNKALKFWINNAQLQDIYNKNLIPTSAFSILAAKDPYKMYVYTQKLLKRGWGFQTVEGFARFVEGFLIDPSTNMFIEEGIEGQAFLLYKRILNGRPKIKLDSPWQTTLLTKEIFLEECERRKNDAYWPELAIDTVAAREAEMDGAIG